MNSWLGLDSEDILCKKDFCQEDQAPLQYTSLFYHVCSRMLQHSTNLAVFLSAFPSLLHSHYQWRNGCPSGQFWNPVRRQSLHWKDHFTFLFQCWLEHILFYFLFFVLELFSFFLFLYLFKPSQSIYR